MRVFFCSHFGDIELVPASGDHTTLRYERLTPAEDRAIQRVVNKFATDRSEPSWWRSIRLALPPDGTGELLVKAPLAEVNAVLAKALGKTNLILGIRYTTDVELPARAPVPMRVLEAHVETLPRSLPAPSPQIERVVAVERPSRGCPMPSPTELKERRAAEVIRPFLNPMQRKDFDALRAFVAIGGDTGHAYRLTSRWNPEVAQHGVLKDLDTGAIVCAQNQGIPPAEELLSLKFAVESLERRFLNKWQD